MTSAGFKQAVQEGRVLRAVRAIPGVRSDTIVGSVAAHTGLNKEGQEIVRVVRTECWDITPEQWEKITRDLVLDRPKGA